MDSNINFISFNSINPKPFLKNLISKTQKQIDSEKSELLIQKTQLKFIKKEEETLESEIKKNSFFKRIQNSINKMMKIIDTENYSHFESKQHFLNIIKNMGYFTYLNEIKICLLKIKNNNPTESEISILHSYIKIYNKLINPTIFIENL